MLGEFAPFSEDTQFGAFGAARLVRCVWCSAFGSVRLVQRVWFATVSLVVQVGQSSLAIKSGNQIWARALK
jgi:hypothetical protein